MAFLISKPLATTLYDWLLFSGIQIDAAVSGDTAISEFDRHEGCTVAEWLTHSPATLDVTGSRPNSGNFS